MPFPQVWGHALQAQPQKTLKKDQPNGEKSIPVCATDTDQVRSKPMAGDRYNEEETRLEKSGDINALQRYRLTKHNESENNGGSYYHTTAEDPHIAHHLYFLEEDLREVVQEEISIQLGLSNKDTKDSERLEILNRKYWLLEQKWWYSYSCLRDGPQQRAFDLWRSHPKWYMHQTLNKDCASRNGCCARGCGCCHLRKPSPKRKLGVGHCTVECGCCRRARGFEVSEEDKEALKKECRAMINILPKHRIIRVATWGLVGDCFESPFDMIRVDAPPSYGS